MPVTISDFLLARHLVSCSVAGGNPNSSGSITFGTPSDLAVASGIKTFRALQWNTRAVLEMIKPSDALWANHLVAGYDGEIIVSELIPANGAGALQTLLQSFDYLSVIALYRQRGANSGGTYVGFWGVAEPLEGSIGETGPNIARVSIRPAGAALYIGGTAPVY